MGLGKPAPADISACGRNRRTPLPAISTRGRIYTWGEDQSLTLHRFAYEQSGEAILAGAIPEPSTYAALAGLLAGSAALFHRRRKKNEAA